MWLWTRKLRGRRASSKCLRQFVSLDLFANHTCFLTAANQVADFRRGEGGYPRFTRFTLPGVGIELCSTMSLKVLRSADRCMTNDRLRNVEQLLVKSLPGSCFL